MQKKLFESAKKYLVGGVNSPVRSFKNVGIDPLLIARGKGAKVFDYNSKGYIDYVLGYGANILGHSNYGLNSAIAAKIKQGLSFGATNKSEVDLAELIHKAIPKIEMMRFTVSGTEAVMGALRLARAVTGRDIVIKFDNFYHGHGDYLLAKSGSGMSTFGIAASKGVPKNFMKDTISLPYGDKGKLKEVFTRYGKNIAAVIVEPVGANHGVIAPDVSFLKLLRETTKKYGSFLVFDEVVTGFRFHWGAFWQTIGIEPDLTIMGKIIGGGLPCGCYGGSAEVMKHLAPLGDCYQASTFAGHPVAMEAGKFTLETLKINRSGYKRVTDYAHNLAKYFNSCAQKYNVDACMIKYGPLFSFKFDDIEEFKRFFKCVLGNGVYFAPSMFEANFISLKHSKKDLEKTKRSMEYGLGKVRL